MTRFSTASPEELYLPIDPSDLRPDVATQEKDPTSMLNLTRSLLKLRHDHPALSNTADFQALYAEEKSYPFVYLRQAEGERIIVSVNPAGRACSVLLKDVAKVKPLLAQDAAFRNGRLEMDPVSFGIFAVEH